jgi:cytochrome b6-f complex iron-sulfur subunit
VPLGLGSPRLGKLWCLGIPAGHGRNTKGGCSSVSWTWVGILVAGAVAGLGLVAVAVGGIRGRQPGRPDLASPARRALVLRGVIVVFVGAMAGVVSSAVTYLASAARRRPRGPVTVASASQVAARFERERRPWHVEDGGFYVVPYPPAALGRAREHYGPGILSGMEEGFVAVSQVCTHLGCRVPWCSSAQWFECPCHGSRFNQVGELQRGPAPRGLDRYPVRVVDGQVVVDLTTVILGPAPGVDTVDQPPAGPHCN